MPQSSSTRPGGPLRIDTLYAWLSRDAAGDEGLCGAILRPGGPWTPLIGADRARVESFRAVAQRLASSTGRPVQLVQFTTRQDLETLQP